jgi:hypothetical protein
MIATMNASLFFAKLVLGVAALALAWFLWGAAQLMLGFARDEALGGSLAGLAVAGVAGAAGVALGRWWGPALIGVQAAGFFILVQFFGRFSDALWPSGLIAMMVASVALVIWHRRGVSGQPE